MRQAVNSVYNNISLNSSMNNFEQLINDLDLRLFEKIPSQSTDQDKQSLLACQAAVRELKPAYNYLEIGSYLGGSIQHYLLDDKCAGIYSIDKRPAWQPDERGIEYVYQNNSTARMMENLSRVAPDKLDKITTIEGDTREIAPGQVPDKIQLCFIDGEHTDEAVLADFKFCLGVLDTGGAILFHDAQVTYNGLANCIKYLRENAIGFHAYSLPNVLFAIEIGDFPMHKNTKILERLIDNHESFLFTLQMNDYYRQFTNKLPFRLVRNFISRFRKGNVSE